MSANHALNAFKVKLPLSLIHTLVLSPTDCMQKMPSKTEVAPPCTQNLKVGRKMVWIWILSSFLVSGNFSKIFKKFQFLEKFHFSISVSRHFHFTFHLSKRVNQIFISLFTSRKEWIKFLFQFSLLEKSETDFHFTSRTFNINSRRTLVLHSRFCFVTFFKFAFVTVWHQDFDSILSEIILWNGHQNFFSQCYNGRRELKI